MKRIITVLCCLAVIAVSVPFSVSAEGTSIEFTAHILDDHFNYDAPVEYESTYYGVGFVPKVIDSIEVRDEVREYCNNEYVNDTSLYTFLGSFGEDFFNEKAIILISAHSPTWGYDYSLTDVTVNDSTLTMHIEYAATTGAAPDAVQYDIIMAEVNKADIAECKEFTSVITDVTEVPTIDFEGHIFEGYIPEETLKEYEETLQQYYNRDIDPYYGRHIDPFIITNADELAEFREDVVSAEFDAFAGGLAEDFFDSKAIMAVYSIAAYSPAVYEFTELELVDESHLYLKFTVDESSGDRNAERVEQHNVLVAVFDKSVLYGNDEISGQSWGTRINVLGDVRETGSLDMMDYILLKRAYFGTYNLDEGAKKRGDVNGNGEIDMMDYILLKRAWFGTYALYGDIRFTYY